MSLFGRSRAPEIPFGLADIPSQVIKTGGRMSISGVQMKLSVRVRPGTETLETVAEGGTHILKPDPSSYPELPRNENLCMNMAAGMGIPVPPHGLFPLADGTLAYLVKRFDRAEDGAKRPKETLFQILGADDKYRGSLEQAGEAIRSHASDVGLATLDFFERTVFCFLIGNGDMHLKNWALVTDEDGTLSIAPGYDFVSSRLHIADEPDSALSLNGKRDKLSRKDFEALAAQLKVAPKSVENVFRKWEKAKGFLLEQCASSALSDSPRNKLAAIIESRYARLFGSPRPL